MHRHRHLWVVAEGEENAGHVVMLPLPESVLLLVILMWCGVAGLLLGL